MSGPPIVAFEGTFCTGKTTQWRRATRRFDAREYAVTAIDETNVTREFIDSLAADGYAYRDLDPYTESLLWATHYAEKMEEASAAAGDVVFLDRFFHSAIAFQTPVLDRSLSEVAAYVRRPFGDDAFFDHDLTVVFTADETAIADRFRKREGRSIPDSELETARRVQRHYEALDEQLPGRIEYVETTDRSIDDVWAATVELVESVLDAAHS